MTTATKWRNDIAPGKQHASFTSICAARDLVPLIIIGRAMRHDITTRLAEAEMTAACFGLGGPPRVGRPYRSADGFDNPIPRAASALVELAMTCPGLYYFATSWLSSSYRIAIASLFWMGRCTAAQRAQDDLAEPAMSQPYIVV